MLISLIIQDFVLIEDMHIEFNEGMTVITGETGSGKSMIIDALSMITGGRAYREKVRKGKPMALISAIFDISGKDNVLNVLNELGIKSNKNIIEISRKIYPNKTSEILLSGTKVTLDSIYEIMNELIDIVGQHSANRLIDPQKHIIILDELGDAKHKSKIESVQIAYKMFEETNLLLNNMELDEKSRNREIDLLEFQKDEIESQELEKFDEDKFMEDYSRAINGKQIATAYDNLIYVLNSDDNPHSITSKIRNLLHDNNKCSQYDNNLEHSINRIEAALIELEDISYELKIDSQDIILNQEHVELLQSKLDCINTLKSKYGKTVEEILDYHKSVVKRLEFLYNYEQNYTSIKAKLELLIENLNKQCKELTLSRKELAKKMEVGIINELKKLAILDPKFEIKINAKNPSENGADQVQFYISTNIGEPLNPLETVASGGELSRIMLAINIMTISKNNNYTMIFDEIDSGISGFAAKVVGEQLKALSKSIQVITITHLPQIAALGNSHIKVKKIIIDDRTISTFSDLSVDERAVELAEMIGGEDVSDILLDSTRSLLKESMGR
ncbi:MAG: DNA repair protein RecN [Tissierellia bacterium]|nr:DNA repair protein RecN [Tissierellia bacterium]